MPEQPAAPGTSFLVRFAGDAVTFNAGQRVFNEGDPGDVMYVVRSGEVDIVVGDEVVETIGTGGIFGEMALIEQDRRSASAVAQTDCELVPINENRFKFLVQQTPFFAIEVMRIMAHRLRQMDARTREHPVRP